MAKQIYRALDNLSPSQDKLTSLPRYAYSLYNCYFDHYGRIVKRKGYTQYNESSLGVGRVQGMHRFYSADGAKRFLVAHNGYIYEIDDAAPHSATQINSSQLSGSDVYFVNYHNKCYLVTGADGVKKYDGTNFRSVGIEPPASGPSGVASAGGSLSAGTYYVKYTFVDEDGFESNPSPESSAITANANDKITLTIATSSDPKVVARRIYRTTANGALYYFDTEVSDNTTTNVELTQSDTSLSAGTILHDNHDVPPATAHLIAKRRSRLMIADGGAFYFSEIADVEYFPATWVIYTGARQRITGLMEQQESLAVFTADSIERLIGQDEENFEFVNAYSSEGCIATRSLVNCENLLLYLGCDGIYVFDGITARLINIPLAEYIKENINAEYAHLSCACFFDNKYLLSYPKGGSIVPNETVYIDFRTGATGVYSFGFACYSRWDRSGDGIQLYAGDNENGIVYKVGEALSDNGSDISMHVEFAPLDFGIPDREKIFYSVYLKCITTQNDSLRLYYHTDDNDEAYVDISLEQNTEKWYRIRFPGGVRGRSISLKPTETSSYAFAISGLMIEFDVSAQEA